MMEIERIYPVDWMGDVGQRNIEEVLEWAKTNQYELYRSNYGRIYFENSGTSNNRAYNW